MVLRESDLAVGPFVEREDPPIPHDLAVDVPLPPAQTGPDDPIDADVGDEVELLPYWGAATELLCRMLVLYPSPLVPVADPAGISEAPKLFPITPVPCTPVTPVMAAFRVKTDRDIARDRPPTPETAPPPVGIARCPVIPTAPTC